MYCISTRLTLFRVKNVRKNIEVQFWFFYFANEEIPVGGKISLNFSTLDFLIEDKRV